MKKIITTAVGALLVLGTGVAMAEQNAKSLATGVCSACHGQQGHSVSPIFPNLAGQQSAYITLQLDAFRGRMRADPNAQAYMWGMASQLSDDVIAGLSTYYSEQKPAKGVAGDAALMAQGQKIYMEGVKETGVPACVSCHGANAEGAAAFPRLAGQHAEYLMAQLQGFQSGTRSNAPIMLAVVRAMTPEQIKAVAVYSASK